MTKFHELDPGVLLKQFEQWLNDDDITFLKKKNKKDILSSVNALQGYFDDRKKEDRVWHAIHKESIKLWEILISHALKAIDSDSKGSSKLFEFLKAATKFEDVLYGLEDYYRDHTIHSLWVYLIGEFLLRNPLSDVRDNLNWYVFNDLIRDIELKETSYPKDLLQAAIHKKTKLDKEINENRDAVWCIIALCHDLGYSLAKMNKLNDRVKDVLKFIELPNFQDIGYSLDIEHLYNVTQFLELMAMDLRIVPVLDHKKKEIERKKGERKSTYQRRVETEREDELLLKCYRDDSTYWRLCRALEQKQHGILSSYIIYKTLGIFADTWVRGPAEEWGIERIEAIDTVIRGDILFAIAQHEFEFAHLYELSSLADILILADELEEFSRLGRQLLTRHYYGTTAYSKIRFRSKPVNNGKDIALDIIYSFNENLDEAQFFDFYRRKAEGLCKMYSLSQKEERRNKEYYWIESINMTVKYKGRKKLEFNFYRDEKYHKGLIPTIRGSKDKRKIDFDKRYEYKMTCKDDKLIVHPSKVEEISLQECVDLIKLRLK